MKKFYLMCSLLMIFSASFASSLVSVGNFSGMQYQQEFYKPKNYDDEKEFIQYKINGVRVAAYNRKDHSYTSFSGIEGIALDNERALFKKPEYPKNITHLGYYLFLSNGFENKNPNLKSYIFDPYLNKVIFESENIKYLDVVMNKNYHFFVANTFDRKKKIIDSNGKVLYSGDLINNIASSRLDKYLEIKFNMFSKPLIFDINSTDELHEIIKAVTEKELYHLGLAHNYFKNNPKYKYVGYLSCSTIYDAEKRKYSVMIGDFPNEYCSQPIYDRVIPFYRYILVKKDNLFGVLSESGEEIIESKYESILVDNENEIQLCNGDSCVRHTLAREKNPQELPEDLKENNIIGHYIVFSKKVLGKKRYGIKKGDKIYLKPIYDSILYVTLDGKYKAKLGELSESRIVYEKNGEVFVENGKMNTFEKFLITLEKTLRGFYSLF